MAFLKKHQYEKRAENAALRMIENSKIKSLTEEQHDALASICRMRHSIHSNKKGVINSEHSDNREFTYFISELVFVYSRKIDSKANLSIDAEDIICDIDYYELSLYDTYEDMEEAARDQLEDFNSRIESWLRDIDKKYNTNYCPTGGQRIF